MIEHGFGISVLPYLDIFKNRNVDVLPLSEAKWESTFYAIRRRDGVRSHGRKNNLEPDYTQFKKGQVGILGKPGKWQVGILTQFKKGQVEVKLGTGFF